MGIRRASLADLEGVFELLVEAHTESDNYSRLPYNKVRVMAAFKGWLQNPKVLFIVSEGLDGIDGVIIGEVTTAWFHDGMMAITHAIYARPGTAGLRLVKEFLAWARSWKAVRKIQISVSFAGERGERSSKLFERLGLNRVGFEFTEVL